MKPKLRQSRVNLWSASVHCDAFAMHAYMLSQIVPHMKLNGLSAVLLFAPPITTPSLCTTIDDPLEGLGTRLIVPHHWSQYLVFSPMELYSSAVRWSTTAWSQCRQRASNYRSRHGYFLTTCTSLLRSTWHLYWCCSWCRYCRGVGRGVLEVLEHPQYFWKGCRAPPIFIEWVQSTPYNCLASMTHQS